MSLPFPREMQQAAAAYSRRDWVEAERICRQVLATNPDQFDALTLLGVIAAQTQRMPDAAGFFARAVTANPHDASTYIKFGNSLEELGRLDEALASYDRAIKLKPRLADAHNNRGNVLKLLMRLDESLASYLKAIKLKIDYAEAYSNCGTVLQALRRPAEALARYERAIRLEPSHPGTWYNRGTVLQELGRLDEAVSSYAQAIDLDPAFASAYNNRGNALKELGRLNEALGSFDQAIALQPDHAQAHSNRANALEELQRPDDALASYEQAMKLDPGLDHLPGAWLHAKMMLCDWTGVESRTAELLVRIGNGEKVVPPLPVLMLTGSLAVQRKAVQIWASDKCPAIAATLNPAGRGKAEKIRIGYFSPDFRNHPVAYLTAELFETHDRARFELTAFSFGANTNDDMRKRLEAAFDHFVDVRALSARDVVSFARKQGIDIAVDLAGFTHNSRPEVFAMRAAPVQVSYLGYLATMGVDYIDYLIADRTLIPEASRQYYSEKIAYLPNSFQANDGKRAISDKTFSREELGLPPTGFVFCCFNNCAKITPGTFEGWMRILKQVAASVLLLYAENERAATNLRKEAIARGVDAGRLVFVKRLSVPEYLARNRIADLFLDTLPYNAGTTASDALWAGLPVLTCMGESYAGRVAASLLNAIGLAELVTTTPEQYETLAVELATDPYRLMRIREKLQGNRLTAPLFNTRLFAGHLEAAYAQMHERRLAGAPPDHIFVKP